MFSLSLFLINAKKKKPFFIILSMLVFILGMATYINFNTLPKDHISYLLKSQNPQHYVRGIIKSAPIYTWQRWGKRRCRLLFKATSYKQGNLWLKARGLSEVVIEDNEIDYYYGDDIVVFGIVKSSPGFSKKNGFNYAKYLKEKGIYTFINIKNDDNIATIEKGPKFSIKRPVYNIRRGIEKRFKLYLPYPDNTLISAMLVASRHLIPKQLRELFVKTGTVHILSVSGLHVAIISAILFFLLKAFCLSRKASSVIIILFLAIYVVLAQERAPILRASIMITIYLLSYILDRDFDIYTALSLAGIIILLINPMQIFGAGFILSFSCIFSLVYLTPKLEALFTHRLKESASPVAGRYVSKISQYIKKLLFASTAVFIGVWPITAIYFKIISPVSIVANIFVVPLLGVILSLSIALACVPVFLKPIAFMFAYLLHGLLAVVLKVLTLLASVPFAYFHISDIPLYMIALYYLFVYIVVRLLLDRNMV
jgi:competence protein ComEC